MRRVLVLLVLAGSTLFTVPAVGQPPIPSGFTAADATTCGAIRLTWNTVPGALGYNILRDGTQIAKPANDVSSFIDYDTPGSGTYTYCIQSFSGAGTSLATCDAATITAIPRPG